MNDIAKIKHLSVGFQTTKGKITAVDDVSFSLTPGETLVLLGESGCGKSMTSLAMMRLLPSDALYGQDSAINFLDEDILNLPEEVMRTIRGRKLAMVFQEPMTALNPVLTIGEQLAEAILAHPSNIHGPESSELPQHDLPEVLRHGMHNRRNISATVLKKRMTSLLREVEISEPEERLRQYPHQLSGGQKQRIVIAMAIACNPEILIADEPTTALDVTIQAQILALLRKLQQQYKMSLLLITHDLAVVKAMATHVCVMYAGHVVESAKASQFFKEQQHPYSQQLFMSLPSFDKRAQLLQTLIGCVPNMDALPSGCRFHPRCAHAFTPCSTIAPKLQSIKEGSVVRCHLYPEHKTLPLLSIHNEEYQPRVLHDETILAVDNLKVHFKESHGIFPRVHAVFKAVDGLSFNLQKGKTLALVGESGCGKTTTSRALMRLQPITSGKAFFCGKNIVDLHGRALREFRKKVQIIFQDPYSSMNPRMTIDDILAEGLQAQRMSNAKIRLRQYELLDQVNLPRNSLSRYPHQFSGGQRQRLCIARALATKPLLLICDEPTSALDMSVQAQILNLLKSLQYEFGLSYLFITHNLSVVSYIADDVLVMQAGKAVEFGSTEQILKSPQNAYTNQLLSSVLTID